MAVVVDSNLNLKIKLTKLKTRFAFFLTPSSRQTKKEAIAT